MPKFMLVYHGGATPEDPAEGEKVMAAWMAWFQGLGDAVIDPGNPAGPSKTVTADGVDDGGGTNPVSGYSLINAADLNDALNKARGCPMVVDGSGSVEVAEALDM